MKNDSENINVHSGHVCAQWDTYKTNVKWSENMVYESLQQKLLFFQRVSPFYRNQSNQHPFHTLVASGIRKAQPTTHLSVKEQLSVLHMMHQNNMHHETHGNGKSLTKKTKTTDLSAVQILA